MPRVPRVCLEHLRLLSDDTGLIQHATHSVARRETGYSTDDNARALIAVARESNGRSAVVARELAHTYLAFLAHAQREDGTFHNYLGYDRRWLDEMGSEDCQGRVAWACAEAMCSALPAGEQRLADLLFERLLPAVTQVTSPRAVALVLLAVEKLPPKERRALQHVADQLAVSLVDRYFGCRHHDWHWFEPVLAYANARLPEGMLAVYRLTGEKRYLRIGMEALDFLAALTVRDGIFVPIGNRRWYRKGEQRSEYDQQPIEAGCMVAAAAAAWRITSRRRYHALAGQALGWFHGRNTKCLPLADPSRGSCHDGLSETGINLNEGAESTVMYLLALQDYAQP